MVFQKDYIMRIVEQFVKLLLSIISFRKSGNFEKAMEDIQTASKCFLKTDLSLLLYYDPEQLLDHFRNYLNELDSEKCIFCADLLYEYALICEAKQQNDEALRLKIACLHLFTSALPKEKQFQTKQYLEKVAALAAELKDIPIPEYIKTSL